MKTFVCTKCKKKTKIENKSFFRKNKNICPSCFNILKYKQKHHKEVMAWLKVTK